MANIHLVTGYSGNAHVTAADHGSLNAAIFGDGQYVLERGSQLAAALVSNNQVRIADGDILMQGRHIRLDSTGYVDLTIEDGASGYNRNDLIVCRYTKDTASGTEECNLVVIKGTATTETATDPAYTKSNIMSGATQADFPLYRIPISGLAVGTPEPLFRVISPLGMRTPRLVSKDTTLTASDHGRVISVSSSSAVTISVPANVPGMEVTIHRMGDGAVKVAPCSGTYFLPIGNEVGEGEGTGVYWYITEIQGSITLRQVAGNMWIAQGDYKTGYPAG